MRTLECLGGETPRHSFSQHFPHRSAVRAAWLRHPESVEQNLWGGSCAGYERNQWSLQRSAGQGCSAHVHLWSEYSTYHEAPSIWRLRHHQLSEAVALERFGAEAPRAAVAEHHNPRKPRRKASPRCTGPGHGFPGSRPSSPRHCEFSPSTRETLAVMVERIWGGAVPKRHSSL